MRWGKVGKVGAKSSPARLRRLGLVKFEEWMGLYNLGRRQSDCRRIGRRIVLMHDQRLVLALTTVGRCRFAGFMSRT